MANPGRFRAVAPGRVNLIGDHTDYMGGLALPMAIDLATTISGVRAGSRIKLRSEQFEEELDLELPVIDPQLTVPAWGRYVAGVAAELASTQGLIGTVTTTVPLGSGLSSSAALEVATALALGDSGSPAEIAARCQQAEHLASGVPCGIMDQLVITSGRSGHAMLIDFEDLEVTPVAVPDSAQFWVIHSGQERQLTTSAYSERRAQAEAAAAQVGPLPKADLGSINSLNDAVLRSRARHVMTECGRVQQFATALQNCELVLCGHLMTESHASLRDDYQVSTDALDSLVKSLTATPGVYGARLTGAGFGGCVVALADPSVQLDGWPVVPSEGARIEWLGD
ncbi:MAG: galactokinase family protein [Microthrixaceae bacterium]